MGFFKEFKDDFSQAVNELMPGEDELTEKEDTLENDDMVVNTLDAEVDTESELSKLNGLLEQVTEQPAPQAVVKPQQVVRSGYCNVSGYMSVSPLLLLHFLCLLCLPPVSEAGMSVLLPGNH